MNKKMIASLVLFSVWVFMGVGNATEVVEPTEFIVSGVIGASMENAQAPADFALAPNGWYNGGHYKTWVDYIACLQFKDYHWLNYARAGEISTNGITHLNNLLTQTLVQGPDGQPVSTVKLLVIGFWANDFIWLPDYNPQVMEAVVQNVRKQIATAKNAGVEKIILLGWPDYNDLNLEHFITLFPTLTTHLNEAGYNESKNHYYSAFSEPSPEYIFVEPWCRFKTIDGAHPDTSTSIRGAMIIRSAIRRYDKLINNRSLFCH